MGSLTAGNSLDKFTVTQLRAMAPLDGKREVDRLNRILAPASTDQKLSALVLLFVNLPMADSDEATRDARMAGYLMAMEGHPIWAIVEARDAFIRGRVPGFSSSFAPNSADLGREIDRRVSEDREALRRARQAVREAETFAELGASQGPTSPETRKLVEAALRRMDQVSKEERERKMRPEDWKFFYGDRDEADRRHRRFAVRQGTKGA